MYLFANILTADVIAASLHRHGWPLFPIACVNAQHIDPLLVNSLHYIEPFNDTLF